MAKQRRPRKQTASSKASGSTRRRSPAKPRASRKKAESRPAESEAVKARREKYLAAVRLYEQALEALQRRSFQKAAANFRQLIEEFPEERELHERCQLYLKVCERESEPPAAPPQTLEERVYAATLALNAGARDEALRHLAAAGEQDPASDHVQYMLAVARALGGETDAAVEHLRRAIELNSDNRLLAIQEPDFDPLRSEAVFQNVVAPPPSARRRPRSRPSR